MREALGHHVEACFKPRFHEESAGREAPGEGVLDYGVLGKPTYMTWVGLTGREDTRTEGLLSCPDGTLVCMDGKLGARMNSFLPL